ncbi:hypothetical protein VTH06DRAFT_8158 [Thermothelomyces fergusii]
MSLTDLTNPDWGPDWGCGPSKASVEPPVVHAESSIAKPQIPIFGASGPDDGRDAAARRHPLVAGPRPRPRPRPRPDGGNDDEHDEDQDDPADLEAAAKVVRELLLWGAIWNDVDDRNETPACVAHRLGRTDLYDLCVEAGVRAEMLFSLMEGYEELGSADGEDQGDDDGDEGAEVIDLDADAGADAGVVVVGEDGEEAPQLPPKPDTEAEVTSEAYLRSKLTYSDGKLVDDDGNGVMMAWETDIMRRSVDALLPGGEPGKRILNVGFGMGIIDTMFAETKPSKHHIIEAHPGVLEHIARPGSRGRWQDVCQQLLAEGQVYDAVYFDTFGEDYAQLRLFFTEFIPALLDGQGRFSFFNGLGADRLVCYDVYTKVVELHLADAGLDVDWEVIGVDMSNLAEAGKGEWEGVKRRYWTLDKYRLPICTFLG